MPIGAPSHRPAPKSGNKPRERPMLAMRLSELGSMGSPLISAFQSLLAGNGSAPLSGAPTPRVAPRTSPYTWPPGGGAGAGAPGAGEPGGGETGAASPPPPPQGATRAPKLAMARHRLIAPRRRLRKASPGTNGAQGVGVMVMGASPQSTRSMPPQRCWFATELCENVSMILGHRTAFAHTSSLIQLVKDCQIGRASCGERG